MIFCVAALSILNYQFSTAQHYIGAKAGYGGAMGRLFSIYGKTESAMVWNKYTAGVMWKYYSAQPVVGGVSVELEYQQRGYRIFDGGDIYRPAVISDTTSYRSRTRTVNSITLPLIWQPHLYFANRHVRVFLNAGFTVTYNTGIGEELTSERWENGVMISSETTPYKMQVSRDNRWNYGFLGGFGVGVLTGRAEIFAEARYYYGMCDILRTSTKYTFNEESGIRSELDNLFVTVGVFFRLGKGGIKAPPLRKRVAEQVENDFRNIKIRY